MSELRTPLTAWHEAHGAKMAPFAGWLMPIQYEGILLEHQHTRQHAGLFDISHMGEFRIQGPGAADALARAVSHNLDTLAPANAGTAFCSMPRAAFWMIASFTDSVLTPS